MHCLPYYTWNKILATFFGLIMSHQANYLLYSLFNYNNCNIADQWQICDIILQLCNRRQTIYFNNYISVKHIYIYNLDIFTKTHVILLPGQLESFLTKEKVSWKVNFFYKNKRKNGKNAKCHAYVCAATNLINGGYCFWLFRFFLRGKTYFIDIITIKLLHPSQ